MGLAGFDLLFSYGSCIHIFFQKCILHLKIDNSISSKCDISSHMKTLGYNDFHGKPKNEKQWNSTQKPRKNPRSKHYGAALG